MLRDIVTSRETVLVFCEGPTDKAFIQYLHDLFNRARTDAKIALRRGSGGTADGIVGDAVKVFGDYTRRVVVLDNDKPVLEMEKARKLANSKNINLIEHTPCIEAILLKVLVRNKLLIPITSSRRCKRMFNNTYFKGKNRTDWQEYSAIFPKRYLNKKQISVPELKKLINLVRGKY